MRNIEQIAGDVLMCALSHEPDARLIGNVTAMEIARLAVRPLTSCPACGAEAWVSIDCRVCAAASEAEDTR